jgi:hypothetical protein
MNSRVNRSVRQSAARNSRVRSARARKATVTQVRQMIHSIVDHEAEDKFFDVVAPGGGAVDYNGVIVALSDVPQGTTDLTRIGDSLTVKRLRISSLTVYNASVTQSTSINIMRMIVVAWKPFYASVAPTVGTIMTYTGATYAAQSYLTHDGKNQFKVLFDQTVVLDSFHKPTHLFRADLKLNHIISYKNASTTNQSNGIYALYISNAASGGPTLPTTASRIDFQDA